MANPLANPMHIQANYILTYFIIFSFNIANQLLNTFNIDIDIEETPQPYIILLLANTKFESILVKKVGHKKFLTTMQDIQLDINLIIEQHHHINYLIYENFDIFSIDPTDLSNTAFITHDIVIEANGLLRKYTTYGILRKYK